MRRKVNYREQVQRFLIVCEGKATEPQYFRDFRVPGDIRSIVVEGLGRSAVSLVQEAIKLKTRDEYDQVWVVFDIDDCTHAQMTKANHLARENGISVAYSNQAFELWFLLHFQYQNSALDRGQYLQKLSLALRFPYTKNTRGLYLRLLPIQAEAVKNAKRLLKQYSIEDPCANDPSTTVFRLVEELNRFSPDTRGSSGSRNPG